MAMNLGVNLNLASVIVGSFLLLAHTKVLAATDFATLVKRSGLPASSLGLVVVDLESETHVPRFAHNSTQEFIPASVTKIATAAVVLKKLGSSYKFSTELWSAGQIQGERLKGDLVLKGGGDPGFVSETMWFLVNEFTRTGIRKIDGQIVVDESEFDAIRTDLSRDPERVDRAYDAPVGAMSFNWNSINIFIRPSVEGKAPLVHLDPIANGYRVDNKAVTGGKGNALEVSRVNNTIVVRGKIGKGVPEVAVYKNVDDPAEWAGRNLHAFLQQRGIEVSGGVKLGRAPEGAVVLAKAPSKPLSQQVADMMKFSNNYVAEMLTKGLAAAEGSKPAALDDGMKIIRRELEGMGIAKPQLYNPSGLSRRNRVRPVDLAKVLVEAERHFPSFAEFLSSFPLAGLDGTLKRRLKDRALEGWIRAKTGNLAGVVSLAGYASEKAGKMRAFVFLYNGPSEKADTARELFDDLAAQLVQ